MQSPPTSPRRRERLQPEPYGCDLGIDGLRSSLQPESWWPAADIWGVGIVHRVRLQNLCPLRSWAAAEEAAGRNAIEASNPARIVDFGRVCIGCVAAIEEGLIRAADARCAAPCRNSWRRRVRSAQSAWSRRGPPH